MNKEVKRVEESCYCDKKKKYSLKVSANFLFFCIKSQLIFEPGTENPIDAEDETTIYKYYHLKI